MLRVCIDLTPIPASKTGVARYALGLLAGLETLIRAGRLVTQIELVCLVNPRDADEVVRIAPSAEVIPVQLAALGGRAGRIAAEQTTIPRLLQRLGIDLYHGIHYTVPVASKVPSVAVFHDPTFWTHSHLHEARKVAYFRALGRAALRRAAAIITVSEWSRARFCESLGVSPERIFACPHGVDPSCFRQRDPDDIRRFRRKLNLEGSKVVAFVATVEPRKNLDRLLAAVQMVASVAEEPLVLVVAGQRGWKASSVMAKLKAAERKGQARYLGYVNEATKLLLLSAADVLAYPSLAEGFGFPVLEALASGTPVVTSLGSATEEVAGNSAFLAEPRDVASLAACLARALFDEEARRRAIEFGKRRAGEYTWERSAICTARAWEGALERLRDT